MSIKHFVLALFAAACMFSLVGCSSEEKTSDDGGADKPPKEVVEEKKGPMSVQDIVDLVDE